MEIESFLARADQLMAIASVADRPAELQRALAFVLDFAGAGFTWSISSQAASRARWSTPRRSDRISVSCSTRTWTSFPPRTASSHRAAKATGCSRAARRT